MGHASIEKLHSEGWLFLANIGEYQECRTPDERVKLFMSRIEKIHLITAGSQVNDVDEILSAGPRDTAGRGIDPTDFNIADSSITIGDL